MNNYRLDASVGPPFLESLVGIAEPSGEAPSSVVSLAWAAAELRFQGDWPPLPRARKHSLKPFVRSTFARALDPLRFHIAVADNVPPESPYETSLRSRRVLGRAGTVRVCSGTGSFKVSQKT